MREIYWAVLSELACYGIPGITGGVTGFRIIHPTIIADKITERPYHLFKYVFAVR